MAINKYPYTNFNEYNLDWIIKTVKDLSVKWAETHQEWEDVQTEWTNYKNYIDTYFENLDLSQEVSDKIDQMAADGYFSDLFNTLFRSDIITKAGQVTSDWIAANLLQETGYVIDTSLTVENAAADAKVVGTNLHNIYMQQNRYNNLLNPAIYGANETTTGTAWTRVKVLENMVFESGKDYDVSVTLSESQEANWYVYLLKGDGTIIIGPVTVSGSNLSHTINIRNAGVPDDSAYLELSLPKANIGVNAHYSGIGYDKITEIDKAILNINNQDTLYNEMLNPETYGSDDTTTGNAWDYVTVLAGVSFRIGKIYQFRITLSELQESNWYINVYKADGTRIIGPRTVSGSNLSDTFNTLEITEDMDGIYVQIGLPKSNIGVHAEYSSFGNTIIEDIYDQMNTFPDFLQYATPTEFIYHWNMQGVTDFSEDVIIPSQSIFDIQEAARLGFRIMEFNIQKTATAGKYVVSHGVNRTFGHDIVDLLGNDAYGISFESVTYAILRANYKYRSLYTKYQVPITSLEEAMNECRKHKIIPLVGYIDDPSLEIVKNIIGNNFILYGGNRSSFKGILSDWIVSPTVQDVKDAIDAAGYPFICSINNPLTMTDADIAEIVEYAHSRGCYLNFAYAGKIQTINLIRKGFDVGSTTTDDVNSFSDGNVLSYRSDMTFSDIVSTGTVSDGVLSLGISETASIPGITTGWLSKACLKICFSGGLKINGVDVYSSGDETIVMTWGGVEKDLSLTITALSATNILSIDYDVSNC